MLMNGEKIMISCIASGLLLTIVLIWLFSFNFVLGICALLILIILISGGIE